VEVSYQVWNPPGRSPWDAFHDLVTGVCGRQAVSSVCELGAGANPLLRLDLVDRYGLDYVLIDVDEDELDKAPSGYTKLVVDVAAPLPDGLGRYDFIFSQTVAEHIRSPEAFHRNVRDLLAPGGIAAHFFPTLYEPVFVINRVLPEALTRRMLLGVQSDRVRGSHKQKFPAFYRWCRGPSRRQRRRFEGLGLDIEQYVGWYGHDYLVSLPPLHRAQLTIAQALLKRPVAALTTYAWVVLRKPD
jgi:SAM-dependent methyltransferase